MASPTYRDLIRRGTKRLNDAGIEEAAREARLLLALAADCQTVDLIAREYDRLSDAAILTRFDVFLERRASREPFAHIAGYKNFFGLTLKSDARALVPRSDSEIAVERALDLLPRGRSVTVADLGTGSGCLLAAILNKRGGVRGIALEAHADTAALARENFKRLALMDRVELVIGSWTDWQHWAMADLVISNPPYIRSSEIAGLDPEVRDYDPRVALDGGEDGLTAYREIISLARKHMPEAAPLVLEIGFDQAESVSSLLNSSDFTDISILKDFSGHDRVVSARSPSAK
ncbi:MAG: peptide chain release factor N(5)-glutamine methyltransferase [Pseudomonadota bacterium]